LRQFEEPYNTVDRLGPDADALGDSLSSANAAVARARLLLAEGMYEDAIAATDDRLLSTLTPGMRGESLAVHSLALACNADLPLAELAIGKARSNSRAVETETTALAAEAVLALRKGVYDDSAKRLLEHVDRTRHVDAFVV